MRFRTATAMTTAMAADAATLALTTPAVRQLPGRLRRADQWLAQAGSDGAAVGLAAAALWLVALWVAVALLSAVAATAPGGLGHAGQAMARRVMPRAVRIVVLGSIGLAVAGTPGLAQASAAGQCTDHSVGARVGVGVGANAKPTNAGDGTAGAAAPTTLAPLSAAGEIAIGWPQSEAMEQRTPRIGWPTTPAPPTSQATSTHRSAQRRSPEGDGRAVTVVPGDSLWLIAAHRLSPSATRAEIAAAWPQWYAANRAVIGPDPDHIEPGQQLNTPPAVLPDQKGASR